VYFDSMYAKKIKSLKYKSGTTTDEPIKMRDLSNEDCGRGNPYELVLVSVKTDRSTGIAFQWPRSFHSLF
jgi:hypothetical protein